MKYLIIGTLFLIGCSPLRSYRKVANDPFRNSAERSLLARAAAEEFPPIKDTPIVTIVVDSSEYKGIVAAYDTLVEEYLRHLNTETSHSEIDTVFLTKIKQLKPATITRTVVKEIPTRSTVIENQLQSKINECSRENEGLVIQAKASKEEQKRTRSTNVWLYIVGSILLVGNIAQLFGKKKLLA